MDDMDKSIFAPLPKSKEAEFSDAMPKLSNIFNKLQDSFTRSYHRHITSQGERDTFNTLMAYIARINDERIRQFPVEQVMIGMILPGLNIHPYKFKENIFYQIRGIMGFPFGYWIFSEEDLNSFYCLSHHSLNTMFPQPTKADLLAILYWHHNKLNNVTASYPIIYPFHVPQVEALRTLAILFITAYWKQCCHQTESSTSNYFSPDFDKVCSASWNLLKITPHPISQMSDANKNPNPSPHKYISNLIRSVDDVFSVKEYSATLQLLWHLSDGNITALNSFHDMLATIYLGQEYINTVTAHKVNVSVIRCKNIIAIKNFIKFIFESSFVFSDCGEIPAPFKQNQTPLIYSEAPITVLLNNLNSAKSIAAEAQGVLVNISTRQGENDLEMLKKVSSAKTISCTKDAIFKNTKHEPFMHYIHITDEPIPTIPYDARIIDLMGDMTGTVYLPTTQDAAIIILLSLFNFFHPIKEPHEYMDTTPPPSFKDDREVCVTFIRSFFKDTTSTISQESINLAKKKHVGKDLSQSKHDQLRLELARGAHITDLGYVPNDDIEEVYTLWQKSAPDYIPETKIINLIKDLYDPLFYVKFNHAKSMLHPDSEEANVKVFYGLSLDMEKVDILKQEKKSQHNGADIQEAFLHYYKDMIDNFHKRQSQISLAPPPLRSKDFSVKPDPDQ